MTMLKVIEVLAESQQKLGRCSSAGWKTVRNVKSIWIENFEATVEDGKLKSYRINAKISFVLE